MSAVVDASLLVAALSDAGAEGRWAEDVVRAGNLLAPHLALVEATNILRRLELKGRMEAGAAARDLLLLDLELVPFTPFAERVWELRWPNSSTSLWRRSIAASPKPPVLAAVSFCRPWPEKASTKSATARLILSSSPAAYRSCSFSRVSGAGNCAPSSHVLPPSDSE